MPDDEMNPVEAIGRYHLTLREEAREARVHYYETGERVSLERVPFLHMAWQAANAAVRYAEQVTQGAGALPKRFLWLGSEYLLIFPPEGPVLLADPLSHENLCVGLPWWVDPMKVKPARKT